MTPESINLTHLRAKASVVPTGLAYFNRADVLALIDTVEAAKSYVDLEVLDDSTITEEGTALHELAESLARYTTDHEENE